MTRRSTIAALTALTLLAGCGGDDDSGTPAAASDGSNRVLVRVADAAVRAEVADDDAEQALGLGGRDSLGRDAGMYFVLPYDSPRFWMKGMRIPLDMIWIKDGKVVDVTARVPPPTPNTPDSQLPGYSPSQPANRALEVNAGWAERHGVRPGDRVTVSE